MIFSIHLFFIFFFDLLIIIFYYRSMYNGQLQMYKQIRKVTAIKRNGMKKKTLLKKSGLKSSVKIFIFMNFQLKKFVVKNWVSSFIFSVFQKNQLKKRKEIYEKRTFQKRKKRKRNDTISQQWHCPILSRISERRKQRG